MKNATPRPRKPFDPWTSTRAEADRAQLRFQRKKDDLVSPTPLGQWMGAQKVKERELAFLAGDELQVMYCTYLCALHGLDMPLWLQNEFVSRYQKVDSAEVGSWDEAFGQPYPKGAQLERLRLRKKHMLAVYRAVMTMVKADPKRPLDDFLFEEAGRPYGFKTTVAKELYYEALRNPNFLSAVDLKHRLD